MLLKIAEAGPVVRVLNFEALCQGSIPWVSGNLTNITRKWTIPPGRLPIPVVNVHFYLKRSIGAVGAEKKVVQKIHLTENKQLTQKL